jgi:hypothetical protein
MASSMASSATLRATAKVSIMLCPRQEQNTGLSKREQVNDFHIKLFFLKTLGLQYKLQTAYSDTESLVLSTHSLLPPIHHFHSMPQTPRLSDSLSAAIYLFMLLCPPGSCSITDTVLGDCKKTMVLHPLFQIKLKFYFVHTGILVMTGKKVIKCPEEP